MRFLGTFFLLAAALCSAGVVPNPGLVNDQPAPALALAPKAAPEIAPEVAQLESRVPSADLGNMDMDLFRRQKWVNCLFSFPLLRINQANRVNIQRTITRRRDDTFTVDYLSVRINAESVGSDRHIGIIIDNPGIRSGSIVLSNYRDTLTSTVARETITVEYGPMFTRTCIRLPRLDGTWYVQISN
ncbi:hypothetical protein E4U54_003690 [Claviceps lovelessii]|nr:hypothetical protein E4U54_003690 [Claviceps lovelessii]